MEKLHEARFQRDRLQNNVQTRPVEYPGLQSSRRNISWLAGGVVLGAIVVAVMWLVSAGNDANRRGMVDSLQVQRHQPAGQPVQPASVEAMAENIANLTEQVQVLSSSVADLKNAMRGMVADTGSAVSLNNRAEQSEMQQQAGISATAAVLEALPVTAAGMTGTGALDSREADMSGGIAGRTDSAATEHAPADNRTKERGTGDGAWTINIASMPQKESAEHVVEKAGSVGIDAGLYPVIVNGQQYWRVHVAGFTTSAEAKSQAGLIKEKLGLKDVWVSRR